MARGGVGAGGGAAYGGSIQMVAGCGGVQLNADVDARGGEGGGLSGGSLTIESTGNVTISSGVQILTEATSTGGVGGDVSIRSDSTLTLQSSVVIDASGDTVDDDGEGATVEITGCKLKVEGGVLIDATGYEGGMISLAAAAAPSAPAPGVIQPLIIEETAYIRVAQGATEAGEIELIVTDFVDGQCSNNTSVACTLATDCVFGCDTGECQYANPDTRGVTTQFDVAYDLVENGSLDSCTAQCP